MFKRFPLRLRCNLIGTSMKICQVLLTLQVDLLFGMLKDSTSQKSRQGLSMSSLLLCSTNPVAAVRQSPATPVTEDRPSLAIGLITVLTIFSTE